MFSKPHWLQINIRMFRPKLTEAYSHKIFGNTGKKKESMSSQLNIPSLAQNVPLRCSLHEKKKCWILIRQGFKKWVMQLRFAIVKHKKGKQKHSSDGMSGRRRDVVHGRGAKNSSTYVWINNQNSIYLDWGVSYDCPWRTEPHKRIELRNMRVRTMSQQRREGFQEIHHYPTKHVESKLLSETNGLGGIFRSSGDTAMNSRNNRLPSHKNKFP